MLLQYARLSYASHCAILGCVVQIRTSSVVQAGEHVLRKFRPRQAISELIQRCGEALRHGFEPASLRRMRPHCETPIQTLILRFLKSSLALSGTALPSELGNTLCFRQRATTSSCNLFFLIQQVEILTGLGCTTRVALRFPYSRECGFHPSSGKQILASHPFVPTRFSSETLPPCASAIWRLSARPMPDPPGLVVKNGTKRLAGFAIPGPSS